MSCLNRLSLPVRDVSALGHAGCLRVRASQILFVSTDLSAKFPQTKITEYFVKFKRLLGTEDEVSLEK